MKFYNKNGEKYDNWINSVISDIRPVRKLEYTDQEDVIEPIEAVEEEVVVLQEVEEVQIIPEDFVKKVTEGVESDLKELLLLNDVDTDVLEDPRIMNILDSLLSVSADTISKALDENASAVKNGGSGMIKNILGKVLNGAKQ